MKKVISGLLLVFCVTACDGLWYRVGGGDRIVDCKTEPNAPECADLKSNAGTPPPQPNPTPPPSHHDPSGDRCSAPAGAPQIRTGLSQTANSEEWKNCQASNTHQTLCVNLKLNPEHCGTCDVKCNASHPKCVSGVCTATASGDTNSTHTSPSASIYSTCTGSKCKCQLGQVRCGDDCVSLASNPLHCGTCDKKCPPGVGRNCVNGVCELRPDCPAGCFSNSTCMDGTHCSIISTNEKSPYGSFCNDKACQCPAGILAAKQNICFLSPTCGTATCTEGQRCVMDAAGARSCQILTPSNAVCAGGNCSASIGSLCIGGKCICQGTDSKDCPYGAICTGAKCDCPTGTKKCGTSCVPSDKKDALCP